MTLCQTLLAMQPKTQTSRVSSSLSTPSAPAQARMHACADRITPGPLRIFVTSRLCGLPLPIYS